MRVRANPLWGSASLIRLLFAAVMAAACTLFALFGATPAAADNHCRGSSTVNSDGGGASAYCFGYSPGRRPSEGGSTQRHLWDAHCDVFPDYQAGYTVDIHPLSLLDEEEVIEHGFDPTGTYRSYLISCITGDGANEGSFGFFVIWEQTTPVPLTVLRDRAAARINPPDPAVASNPPLDDPDRFGVVWLPTWLWLDDPWDPIGPESETSGLITVQVIAFPREVSWAMGDGSDPVVCGGPGVPWASGMPEDGTDCSHTYTSSSADLTGEAYEVTATVEWYFEWWINGASQGEFDAYEASTSFPYRVGEIHAIESN